MRYAGSNPVTLTSFRIEIQQNLLLDRRKPAKYLHCHQEKKLFDKLYPVSFASKALTAMQRSCKPTNGVQLLVEAPALLL